MSLLDQIGSAQGESSSNYIRASAEDGVDGVSRTVIKISRVKFRGPGDDIERPKAAFRIDGEILGSTLPKHAAEVGFQGTMNLGFNYPKDDLAKMRRALAAAGTSKGIGKGEGGRLGEAEFLEDKGLAGKLVGPDQPLVGAVVTIVARTKGGKKFTHYEVEVPNASDLALVAG